MSTYATDDINGYIVYQTVTVDEELISNKSKGKGKGNSSTVKRRGAPAPVESDNSAKHRKLECLSDLKKFFVIVKIYFLLEPCLKKNIPATRRGDGVS